MIGADWLARARLASKCLPAIVVAATLLAVYPTLAQQAGAERWVGTWTTAPVGRPQNPPMPAPPGRPPIPQTPQRQSGPPAPAPFLHVNNQTLRQIVRVSIGGATLTPFEGAAYFTTVGEGKRQAVNQWIRRAPPTTG